MRELFGSLDEHLVGGCARKKLVAKIVCIPQQRASDRRTAEKQGKLTTSFPVGSLKLDQDEIIQPQVVYLF